MKGNPKVVMQNSIGNCGFNQISKKSILNIDLPLKVWDSFIRKKNGSFLYESKTNL